METVYKFAELTLISSLLEVQVEVLKSFVGREESEDKLKVFKSELAKMKSINTKTKKMISDY